MNNHELVEIRRKASYARTGDPWEHDVHLLSKAVLELYEDKEKQAVELRKAFGGSD